jgi:hypothetical protein
MTTDRSSEPGSDTAPTGSLPAPRSPLMSGGRLLAAASLAALTMAGAIVFVVAGAGSAATSHPALAAADIALSVGAASTEPNDQHASAPAILPPAADPDASSLLWAPDSASAGEAGGDGPLPGPAGPAGPAAPPAGMLLQLPDTVTVPAGFTGAFTDGDLTLPADGPVDGHTFPAGVQFPTDGPALPPPAQSADGPANGEPTGTEHSAAPLAPVPAPATTQSSVTAPLPVVDVTTPAPVLGVTTPAGTAMPPSTVAPPSTTPSSTVTPRTSTGATTAPATPAGSTTAPGSTIPSTTPTVTASTAASPTSTSTPGPTSSSIEVDSDTVEFGDVKIGTTADRVVRVTNRGTDSVAVQISDLSTDDGANPASTQGSPTTAPLRLPFIATDGCSGRRLEPGGSCALTYVYAPTSNAPSAGTHTISVNGAILVLHLHGNGDAPA